MNAQNAHPKIRLTVAPIFSLTVNFFVIAVENFKTLVSVVPDQALSFTESERLYALNQSVAPPKFFSKYFKIGSTRKADELGAVFGGVNFHNISSVDFLSLLAINGCHCAF